MKKNKMYQKIINSDFFKMNGDIINDYYFLKILSFSENIDHFIEKINLFKKKFLKMQNGYVDNRETVSFCDFYMMISSVFIKNHIFSKSQKKFFVNEMNEMIKYFKKNFNNDFLLISNIGICERFNLKENLTALKIANNMISFANIINSSKDYDFFSQLKSKIELGIERYFHQNNLFVYEFDSLGRFMILDSIDIFYLFIDTAEYDYDDFKNINVNENNVSDLFNHLLLLKYKKKDKFLKEYKKLSYLFEIIPEFVFKDEKSFNLFNNIKKSLKVDMKNVKTSFNKNDFIINEKSLKIAYFMILITKDE